MASLPWLDLPHVYNPSSHDKCNHCKTRKWLRDHAAAQEEEADAAKNDRCGDPALVRAFKIRLLDP